MIVGVGNRVLVYDALDGDLQHSLKGHKDTVYAVTYSADGKRFASGDCAGTIIIWKGSTATGLEVHPQVDIQHLAYNPVTYSLCLVHGEQLWDMVPGAEKR